MAITAPTLLPEYPNPPPLFSQGENAYTVNADAHYTHEHDLIPLFNQAMQWQYGSMNQLFSLVGNTDAETLKTLIKEVAPASFVLPENYNGTVAEKIEAAAADGVTKKKILLLSGNYALDRALVLPKNLRMYSDGATLDGTGIGGVASDMAVTIGSSSHSVITTTAGAITKGDISFSVASAGTISEGDVLAIVNDANSSYSTIRPSYKNGELVEVRKVEGTTVYLKGGILSSLNYIAGINVYKVDMGTFELGGNLSIKATNTGALDIINIRGMRMGQGSIQANSTVGLTCTRLKCCMDSDIQGIFSQGGVTGSGTDYGLMFANCQNINFRGVAIGGRHGVSHGGSSINPQIVNRNIKVLGTVGLAKNVDGSAYAYDSHGNSEYLSMYGNVFGGIGSGGDYFKFRGYATNAYNGCCFERYEAVGFNVDLRDCKFYSDKIADDGFGGVSDRGVVDVGSNNTPSDNFHGGVADLRGIRIDAPNSVTGVHCELRNLNGLTKNRLLLQDSDINLKNSGTVWSVRCEDYIDRNGAAVTGGQHWELIDLRGMSRNYGNILIESKDKHYMRASEVKGEFTIAVTAGGASQNQVVSFPVSFSYHYIAVITAQCSKLGFEWDIDAVGRDSYRITVRAKDGGTFPATETLTFNWRAS